MGDVTLTEFLVARLDEDEAVARAAYSGPWKPYGDHSEADAAHIARHDPARVLREVEAKRRIVAAHPIATDLSAYSQECGAGLPFGCETCHEWDGIICGYGYCPTLRALAAVYSDRPGWDEGWAL